MLYMKQKNRQKNTFEEKPLLQLKQNLSPFFSISIKRFSLLSLNLELPSPVFRDTRSI